MSRDNFSFIYKYSNLSALFHSKYGAFGFNSLKPFEVKARLFLQGIIILIRNIELFGNDNFVFYLAFGLNIYIELLKELNDRMCVIYLGKESSDLVIRSGTCRNGITSAPDKKAYSRQEHGAYGYRGNFSKMFFIKIDYRHIITL